MTALMTLAPAVSKGLESIRSMGEVLSEPDVESNAGTMVVPSVAGAIEFPRVLVLDEATSPLDTASERLVQEALARLMRGRTTFVVAHRLSTIRGAHRIAVMRAGRIEEIGSHAKLMAAGGSHAELQHLSGPAR